MEGVIEAISEHAGALMMLFIGACLGVSLVVDSIGESRKRSKEEE